MCVFACMKTKVCAKLTRTKAQEQHAMAFTAVMAGNGTF